MTISDWVWYGTSPVATLVRGMLAPAEWAFGAVVLGRNALFDAGWRRTHDPAISTISVGNLTVGGTGKTPIAAWFAAELQQRGARPAMALRGYGDDEPLVHRQLNPEIPVVVNADRLLAIDQLATMDPSLDRAVDVVVLDDAFQHRRVARVADIVLISADRWRRHARLLPAGPFREPLTSIRRASLVVITRKAADADVVEDIDTRLATIAPRVPRAVIHLALDSLIQVGDDSRTPLSSIARRRVRAISSIGDPSAFAEQLRAAGASVTAIAYPDHHRFSAHEIAGLSRSSSREEMTLCTLKDAVKLFPTWPRDGCPLWYVSQRLVVERGDTHISRLLTDVADARRPAHQ